MGLALLALFGLALFLLFEAEGLRLFAMALPEVVGWAVIYDITAAADVLAGLLVVASATRLKPATSRLRLATSRVLRTFGAVRRAARAIRAASARRSVAPRRDDPEPQWALA